jgi:hypothetical protein
MPALTKDQARAPKRKTIEVRLPEYDAPLLVAEASGLLALRLNERKTDLRSEEGLSALAADMVVDGSGKRMFSPEEARAFLEDLCMESITLLFQALTTMLAPAKGDGVPGNSTPAINAA